MSVLQSIEIVQIYELAYMSDHYTLIEKYIIRRILHPILKYFLKIIHFLLQPNMT